MKDRPLFSSAKAPGKVILFGEHAINRGQPALAASIGLYCSCSAKPAEEYIFQSKSHRQHCNASAVLHVHAEVEALRKAENYEGIRELAQTDYFSPQKYILGSMFGAALPRGFELVWESEIPSSSGMGSGGAAFTALVTALVPFLEREPSLEERADWAHRGDIVAHGGVASALDTQTSLLGGIIRFTGKGLAQRVAAAPGLNLIVAHCGQSAATSEVNSRVRRWLAEQPAARLPYFQTVGLLTQMAIPALAEGNWNDLGKLLNLNQLVLEKIGVSTLEIDRLIAAAFEAGALGAKVSGSGGGGIFIALVPPDKKEQVATVLQLEGATVYLPAVGVAGAADQRKIGAAVTS
jgi:mevalonate kinase